MVGVTDEQNVQPGFGIADRFPVDLGDQRARGVDSTQVAALGFTPHFRADSVSTEYQYRSLGDGLDGFGKHHALGFKAVDDVPIVHDVVVDVDWLVQNIGESLDHFDRHCDARTEPPWIGQ